MAEGTQNPASSHGGCDRTIETTTRRKRPRKPCSLLQELDCLKASMLTYASSINL